MTAADLAAAVTPVFLAAAQARIARAVADFARARDRELAATDLAEVGRAAVAGRVATLLFEADRLNEQASNKLLKTIEEPPARSTIMLVTSSPDGISETSQVLVLDPATGVAGVFLPSVPYKIVGAGVSTCAPVIE